MHHRLPSAQLPILLYHQKNCITRCNQSGSAAIIDKPKNDFSQRPQFKSESPSTCQEIFRLMDTNKDGLVSKKEFVNFIESRRAEHLPDDGSLTPLQKAVLSVAGKNLEELFDKYDTDHDGSLTHQEVGIP